LQVAAGVSSFPAMQTDPALMTAETLLGLYARRALSPIEALEAITERIARLNPRVNAFAVLDPRALAEAGRSAARWRAGRPIGPLDGVPVTVKDLIDVEGLPTRRGSRLTDPTPVSDDAPLVVSLRAAGAVLLGKTTTTEFGWKTPGDCPLHGITRNPWDLSRTTGGSSAGAAAAAAACFGPLHVGTDAGGSVRIPAAWCGVVGLKPTFGRVPQWPLGAFGPVAAAGPMTRTVHDAALLLGVIARHDARDPFCLPDDSRDWRIGLNDGVDGLRVAVLAQPGFEALVDQDGISAVEAAAGALVDAGAEVEQPDLAAIGIDLPDIRNSFGRLWAVALARLVESYPANRRPMLDPGLPIVAEAVASVTASDMMDAEALRVRAAHAMSRLHQRYDLILCPTVPGGPPLAEAPLGNPNDLLWSAWAPWTALFNLSRQPAVSVPVGLGSSGMPRAVQIAAALYRDDLALRGARTLERAFPPGLASF